MQQDYGYAQICRNGHIISYKLNSLDILQNFCATCGAEVINKCDNCQTPIRGGARFESSIYPPYDFYSDLYERPSYCNNCGDAFPWIKSAQQAAFDLVEFSTSLNDAEKSDLKSSIDNLLVDSPKTTVSIVKFKSYITKAGSEIGKGLRDILIDVVSETVKKSIWGNA